MPIANQERKGDAACSEWTESLLGTASLAAGVLDAAGVIGAAVFEAEAFDDGVAEEGVEAVEEAAGLKD